MFKNYEILVDSDIKNLEAQIKNRLPNNWIPISEITVAPQHGKGYNQYFIQVAEIDPARMHNFTNFP